MGCFSFKCLECGDAVTSDSFSGEYVHLFLLKEGKVLQQMTGEYDSYGTVFIDPKDKKKFSRRDWKGERKSQKWDHPELHKMLKEEVEEREKRDSLQLKHYEESGDKVRAKQIKDSMAYSKKYLKSKDNYDHSIWSQVCELMSIGRGTYGFKIKNSKLEIYEAELSLLECKKLLGEEVDDKELEKLKAKVGVYRVLAEEESEWLEGYEPKPGNGIAAIHVACYKGTPPSVQSEDDPDQGWGPLQPQHWNPGRFFDPAYFIVEEEEDV